MPNIKFNRDRHGFKAGHVYPLDGGTADVYVGQGHAEYVTDAPATPKSGSGDGVPGHSFRQPVTRDIPGPKDPRRSR